MSIDVLVIPQPEVQDLQLPSLRIQTLDNIVNGDSLAAFQQLVGGMIDVLPNMIGGTAAIVINDDGKFDPKCRPNIWATRLASSRIGEDDYICGTAVLVDVNPGPGGETLGISKQCVRLLLEKGVPIQGAVDFLTEPLE